MWQLLDIAYVIPATTFLAYAISKYWLHSQQSSTAVLIGAACGFILTGFKIKNYVDRVNQEIATKLKSKTENNAK